MTSEVGLDALRSALKRVTGTEWSVRVEKDQAATRNEPTERAEIAPQQPTPNRLGRNEILRLPIFEAVAEKLGAQLVRLDDGFDPTAAAEDWRKPVVADEPTDEG